MGIWLMDRARDRGFPQFIIALQHDYDSTYANQVWQRDLAPLRYILENPEDLNVFQIQRQKACMVLWSFLRQFPQEPLNLDVNLTVFLLGYTPQSQVPPPPEDAEILTTWQSILGRLFRCSLIEPPSTAIRTQEASQAASASQDDLLNLIDEVDDLLVPRLTLWHKAMQWQREQAPRQGQT